MPASPPKRKKPTWSFTKAANSSSRARARRILSNLCSNRSFCRKSNSATKPCCNPELLAPRIGVDESGKGDFFGPLCVAGVYINESVVAAWKGVGIRDSKAHFQRPPHCRTGQNDSRHARLRPHRRAHWQRSLQPALPQNAQRQCHAGLGPRPRHRKPDGPCPIK